MVSVTYIGNLSTHICQRITYSSFCSDLNPHLDLHQFSSTTAGIQDKQTLNTFVILYHAAACSQIPSLPVAIHEVPLLHTLHILPPGTLPLPPQIPPCGSLEPPLSHCGTLHQNQLQADWQKSRPTHDVWTCTVGVLLGVCSSSSWSQQRRTGFLEA